MGYYMSKDKVGTVRNYDEIRTFDDRVRPMDSATWRRLIRFLSNSSEMIRLSEIEDLSTGNLQMDFGVYKKLISEANLELFGIDMTPVDGMIAGFYVVRTIIPEVRDD